MAKNTFRFYAEDPTGNREEIDRLTQRLQEKHPTYTVLVSQGINGQIARIRFALPPVMQGEVSDYNLGVIEVPVDTDIDEDTLLRPVSEGIAQYEERTR